MPVYVLSPDPDFRLLLDFMLRFQGFDVEEASFESPPPVSGAADSPTVLIADLSDEEAIAEVAAVASRHRSESVLLVLSRPGQLMACARRLLPDAAAYLPVPLVPMELIRYLSTLSADEPVQGYAVASPGLARLLR